MQGAFKYAHKTDKNMCVKSVQIRMVLATR